MVGDNYVKFFNITEVDLSRSRSSYKSHDTSTVEEK